MKKRLLSVALVLAMVLTLLPLSAFAATAAFEPVKAAEDGSNPGNGSTTVTVNGNTGKATWSYKDGENTTQSATSDGLTTGVIVGSRGSKGANFSGTYYTSFDDAYNHKTTNSSFILLDSDGPSTVKINRNITVDLNGKDFTLETGFTVAAEGDHKNVSQLTFRDYNKDGKAMTEADPKCGQVNGSIVANSKNFTLDLTNVDASGLAVTLNNESDTATTQYTLTVKANNSKVGALKAYNAKISATTVTNDSVIDSIESKATTSGGSNARTGVTLTLDTRSKVENDVEIYGAGTVNLKNMSKIVGNTKLFGANDASDGKDGDDKVPAYKTSITVDGTSTMGAITQQGGDENGHKIDVKGSSTVGAISLNVGGSSDIDITSAFVKDSSGDAADITIARGTVDIKNSMVGNIEAGNTKETGATTITVGALRQADSSSVGNITKLENAKSSPKLVVYGGTVGAIGTVSSSGKSGTDVSHDIYGGTVGSEVDAANLKEDLNRGYQIKLAGTKTTYTYTTNFQDLIDKYASKGTSDDFVATRVGDTIAASGNYQLTFQWKEGSNVTPLTVLTIPGGNIQMVTLPKEVNNTTVDYWYDAAGDGLDPVDNPFPVSTTTTLVAQIGAKNDKQLTGVKAVDVNETGNPSITATLSGTTINLSGAVKTSSTTGNMKLFFEVDGKYATGADEQAINVGWDISSGKIVLAIPGSTSIPGVSIPTANSNQVKVYDTTYTVTGSGLKAKLDKIKIEMAPSKTIVVPNASAGMTNAYTELGKLLKASLEGSTARVNFGQAIGVEAALNTLVANLSSTSSMVSSAQNAMASYENRHKVNSSDRNLTAADFADYDTVVLAPYLEISASNPTIPGDNKNPIITLTITLKARYTVESGTNGVAYKDIVNGEKIDWEQVATPTITGECGQVDITLVWPTGSVLTFTGDSYVHHDGQVYTMTSDVISNLNGFAVTKFEINNTKPIIEIKDKDGNSLTPVELTFDNLQDAVDAVKNNQIIEVNDNFNGSVNLTGAARKFTVKAVGGHTVTLTVNGASTTSAFDESSNQYEVQLTSETTRPVSTVSLSTGSASNGTISLSSTSAKAGDTITVSLTPSTGYASSGVSVQTNTGSTVSASGSGDRYTFTVPSGATSITVTPTFVRAAADAAVVVASVSGGSGTTNVGSQRVPGGTAVTFTANPYSGYRTMSVTVRSNLGSVSVNKVNSDNFTFTVPAGAETVTVTPTFDRDVGIPFIDVWSTETSYLEGVQFTYTHGMINGVEPDQFGGNQAIRRGQLVTILYRLEGSPSASTSNQFVDVNPNEYYARAITWAAGKGIVNGTSPTTYEPDREITRQELATILYRFNVNYKKLSSGNKANLTSYSDRGQVQDWAMDAVQWCVGNGIVNGTSSTTLSPTDGANRYQAATMLTRYCKNFLHMT